MHIQYLSKKNRANGFARDEQVPSEDVYNYELYLIIASWLPSNYPVFVQPTPDNFEKKENPKGKNKKNCDIMIKDPNHGIYLIEIAAHLNPKGIIEHFDRTQYYYESFKNVVEAWVVVFTCGNTDVLPDIQKNPNIGSIYVKHYRINNDEKMDNGQYFDFSCYPPPKIMDHYLDSDDIDELQEMNENYDKMCEENNDDD